MNISVRPEKAFLLLAVLMLVSTSACGSKVTPTASSPTTGYETFSTIPLGSGTTPEPGTDGKPRPSPSGHSESIVVANGLAYVGSDNGTIYAFGAQDGKVRWQYKAGTSVLVYVVDNDVVYATADNVAYALDASRGTLLWQYRANTFISQVTASAGEVYVNTAAEGNVSTLYALRATDGGLLWRYSLASVTPGLLGVIGDTVYDRQALDISEEPNTTQTVYALRASDGAVLRHVVLADVDGLVNGAPVEVNGVLYIATSHGAIYAFRAGTTQLLWHAAQSSLQPMDPVVVSPLVVNGVVYIADTQGVSAFRASDGTRIWQYKGPQDISFQEQPVLVDGVVYFGENTGLVVALRATDGHLLWQQRTAGVFRPLTVADGLVIIDSGPVYALRARDGTILWQRNVQGASETSDAALPEAVGDGVVYIGSDDGSVQALRADDGTLLWRYAIPELTVPTEAPYDAFVSFTPSTTYQQTLAILTDLGLKTYRPCHPQSWVAGDDKGGFPTDPTVTVLATVNSAPLWFDRLAATPDVKSVQAGGFMSCPLERPDNGPHYLPSEQAGTFLRVTFAATTQYAAALDATNALGFRLADPCYEQARAQGMKPTWRSMGQEDAFGKTHTLLLATTRLNATIWMSQLAAVAGVVMVESPYKVTC